MKNKASLISAILVICLLFTMLCSCAQVPNNGTGVDQNQGQQGGESNQTDTNSSGQSQAGSQDSQNDSQNGPQDEPQNEPQEEPVELAFWSCVVGGTAADYSAIEAKVNEITEREINVRVTLNIMNVGDYLSRGALAISSGEKADIFVRSFGSLGFSVLLANRQVMDIEPYMDEYGAPLKELFGDLLDAGRVAGGLYGIPGYRTLNSSVYIGMRKDILDELGMTSLAENMKSWAEYEQIMEAVKENYGDSGVYAVAMNTSTVGAILSGTNFADAKTVDYCGDSLYQVGALNDGDAEALAWNEDQIAQWSRFAEWAERGYVWPDSSYSDMTSQDVVKTGVVFSELFVSEIGCEETKKTVTGYEYICKKVIDIPMSTDNVNKFGLVVNANCEEPEAAMKFISLLYTSPELMNLMVYGIEDENYVVNDEGVADYPVAGDSSSSAYHADEFLFGNQFLLYPWGGAAADSRKVAMESFEAAPLSGYLGFSLDPVNVENAVTTISAVRDTYNKRLNGGDFSAELLADFQEDLKHAGIDDYLAEIQRQVAAWKASK